MQTLEGYPTDPYTIRDTTLIRPTDHPFIAIGDLEPADLYTLVVTGRIAD